MTTPLPGRCIWCLRSAPDVAFDVSHVLPRCLGNLSNDVLPAGVICRECNNFFGHKLEPVLLRDPLLHDIAVFQRIADPADMNEFRDRLFDDEHPAEGKVERDFHVELDVALKSARLVFTLGYAIRGKQAITYRPRDRRLLSRAVHKMALEEAARQVFVDGVPLKVDLFGAEFDDVRNWSKRGEPQNSIRPIIRFVRPNEMAKPEYGYFILQSRGALIVELHIFGDCYVVNLTSSPQEAEEQLKRLAEEHPDPSTDRWLFGERLESLR